jgi:Carboxypeptidase regulatory-like domain
MLVEREERFLASLGMAGSRVVEIVRTRCAAFRRPGRAVLRPYAHGAWRCGVLVMVCACVCLAGKALGQSGVGNISGKVVAVQGTPVRKAVVTLNSEGEGAAEPYTTATDAAGVFRLEGVAAGSYQVSVGRSGYFLTEKQETAMRVTVEAGLETAGLVYRLEAAGVVTGKIVDADGDGVPEVVVSVLRRAGTNDDAAGVKSIGSGTTNDLGEFRVANVPAGIYVVQAEPRSGERPVPSAADKGHARQTATYVGTYFPGVLEEKQAGVVLVKAGETAKANFGLLTSETYRVAGTLSGVASASGVQLVLVSAGGSELRARLDENGKFAFASVLSGTYEAKVLVESGGGASTGGNRAARYQRVTTPVVVNGADVMDLELQAETDGTVSGRFRMDGEEKVDWTLLKVKLEPVQGAGDDSGVIEVDLTDGGRVSANDDGSFAIKDVRAGTYRVDVEMHSDLFRDFYVKSVIKDGREVVDAGFAVNAGTVLDVVMSAKGALIEGTVVDAKGYPVVDAFVVTVPSSGARARPGAYQQVQAGRLGKFELHGLQPGEFLVVAFEKDPGDVRGVEFLRKYEARGEKVSLGEGDTKSVQLVMVPKGY